MKETLDKIIAQYTIPILRHNDAEGLFHTAKALSTGGLKIIEITLMNEDAYQVISKLAQDPTLLIGAGTVLNVQSAQRAIDAGAKFLVSPGLEENSVIYAHKRDIPFVPGVLTPTEVMKAQSIGCQMLKFFPASAVGGTSYLKLIRAPFPDLKWMCTGGIGIEDIKTYREAGATCVGIGGQLAPPKFIESKQWGEISKLAQRAKEVI